MELTLFNVNDGFTEALARGLRSGFLTPDDYRRLATCESLVDVRTALEDTDYGNFLQDDTGLTPALIKMRCREKLADEFTYLEAQCVEPLASFLSFVRQDKMIDNVVDLIQGAINKKDMAELLSKADPLGMCEEFKTIPALDLAAGFDELYKTVLIDTPIGVYFEEFLRTLQEHHGAKTMADMGGMIAEADMELLKQVLKKAWLEAFNDFCQNVGGTTAEVMGHLLKKEADFRVLLVTMNALNTKLGTSQMIDQRNSLFPTIGYLYPEGVHKLRQAANEQAVRNALEPFTEYFVLYEKVKGFYDPTQTNAATNTRSLEDEWFKERVDLCELAFENQFHYGVFYAWVKLREQEIRNIEWICAMIQMKRREQTHTKVVQIFKPRH